MKRASFRSGFTLIELLVVIALIAVLSGALALGLRDGDRSQALQSAQGTLNSLVSAARSQAALSQGRVAVLVWADETKPDTFLRYAVVAREVGTNDWEVKGDGLNLPRGIFFVPPDANGTGSNGAKLATATDWTGTNNLLSAAAGSASRTVDLQVWNQATSSYDTVETVKVYETASFDSLGRLGDSTVNRFVLSVGERESDQLVTFASPDRVRGVILSRYGIPFFVNEKLGFKN